MDKETLVYIYMEYYSAIKKNIIMAFTGKWMELQNVMLTEISQSQKNQKLNVFPNKWRMIYNGGGRVGREIKMGEL